MEYISIPLPDFSFSKLTIEKAREVCDNQLGLDAVESYFYNDYLDRNKNKRNEFKSYIYELNSTEDRITFISVILNHLSTLVDIANKKANSLDRQYNLESINKARYFFYGQAKDIGYNLDTDAFTDKEVNDLDKKIDSILEALDKVQAGQAVLYNEFEEIKTKIKSDFESLKMDKPLGKRRFYKIGLGTILSYAGEKIADEIFAQISPHILAMFTTQPPHLIETIEKMINQNFYPRYIL